MHKILTLKINTLATSHFTKQPNLSIYNNNLFFQSNIGHTLDEPFAFRRELRHRARSSTKSGSALDLLYRDGMLKYSLRPAPPGWAGLAKLDWIINVAFFVTFLTRFRGTKGFYDRKGKFVLSSVNI